MFYEQAIQGLEPLSEEQSESLERKALTSKLKSLNTTLTNLLQKKIRLEIEIKRTKKKLKELQSYSQTKLRLKVAAEGLVYDFLTKSGRNQLLETFGREQYEELENLDEQVFIALRVLESLSKEGL